MLRKLPPLLLFILLLAIVACGTEEDATPTAVPDTATPKPAATEVPPTAPPAETPEPSPTPTEVPPTETPKPSPTSEPESAVSPAGYWEGALSTSGIELTINVEFVETDEGLIGSIDIPQQQALGLPLDNISLEGDQLHFEIAAVGALFDGTVTPETIAGDFEQAAATGTFELAAAEKLEEEAEEAVELPYTVEEVVWEIDDTTVDATLTVPEGDGPFPAVLLIAGSGPTDRDWNTPLLPGDNGSGALFADALTRAGYVTLRYDKRVSGQNALANLEKLMGQISLQSHLDEAAGGVGLLAEREEVDPSRIFALGNSEGTLHALNYQRQATEVPLAGLILAAPPGRPLMDVIRTQIEPQLAALDDPEGIMALFDEAVDRFLAGEAMAPSPDLPDGIQQLLASFEVPANLPFTREIMVVDPAEWLNDVTVPVLVLVGKKDIQIDWQLDGGRLEEAAAGNENVVFLYPENANHVFKYEEKPAEEITAADAGLYNSADRVLDEESLAVILDWLSDR